MHRCLKNRYLIRTHAGSLELQINREVVLDSWHHAAYEFQEDEKALSDLGLTTIGLYRLYDCFHYLGVIARMNTRLLHIQVRVLLHSYCLLCIICSDVLKYFSLRQRIASFTVTREPKPWRLGVEIICYAQIVFADLQD